MEELKIIYLPPQELIPYENNAKLHPAEQVAKIANSLQRFGFRKPVVIDENNVLVAGHGAVLAAQMLGLERVPCVKTGDLTEAEVAAYRLADNETNKGENDFEKLEAELEMLRESDLEFDMSEFGFEDYSGDNTGEIDDDEQERAHKLLTDRFIVPPFSVIDGKQGYYLKRKRAWRELINDYGQARQNAKIIAQTMNQNFADASLLDPVMSEAMVRWFTPGENCKCFDVFAGDTVFGYVASYLGHSFTGIELRQEQADYNNAMISALDTDSKYICDDGRNVLAHIQPDTQDLFFSCPPYFDLEVYSDNPNDASNQATFEEFYSILDTAFANAIKCLKGDRFAIIVCSNIRNKKTGFYYDFTGAVKKTFLENGMQLYNDIVLADPIGTAAQRAGKYMEYRKVAKVHQNILVFYKGDSKNIKSLYKPIDIQESDIEGLYESTDI